MDKIWIKASLPFINIKIIPCRIIVIIEILFKNFNFVFCKMAFSLKKFLRNYHFRLFFIKFFDFNHDWLFYNILRKKYIEKKYCITI